MKPRLDPLMGETVIAARVALQLTLQEYRRQPDRGPSPSECAHLVARRISFVSFPMVKLALHSLSVYLDLGVTSRVWLHNVLEAAHYGHSFRRCFHWDYKENRRPYPRVTNRGVQVRPPHTGAALETGRNDA